MRMTMLFGERSTAPLSLGAGCVRFLTLRFAMVVIVDVGWFVLRWATIDFR